MTNMEQTDHDILVTLAAHSEAHTKALEEVKTQTTLTNGRVGALESWRDKAIGAWFVVSLAGPIITGLIISMLN